MHITSNIFDKYIGSGKALINHINKYGKKNFKTEILEFLPDRESLISKEIEVVNEFLIKDPMCLNIKVGGIGGGGFHSKEHALKAQIAGGKATCDMNRNIHFNKLSSDVEYRNKFCKAISESHIGELNPFYAKNHTEETKEKMSLDRKGSGCGESNSQYGTCWITKDNQNKKINKDLLDEYLKDNWIKGRKI
jgi:group I intron endonuclease